MILIITIVLYQFIILLSYLYFKFYNKKTYPKNMKPIKFYKTNYKRVSIDRDRYSKKKIPKDLDVIVIGSGIGGLSTAGFLARTGRKVLVLEQHYIAGGCTHVFEEKGVEHETGIHYIGNIEKRTKILNLITNKPLEWCKMGHENPETYIYDEFVINNKKYVFRAGEKNFIEDMIQLFPEEEQGIRDYIKLVKRISQKDLFFNLKIVRNFTF